MPGFNPAKVERLVTGHFVRVSSLAVRWAWLSLLLATVMLPSVARAQVTPIDDFESYADSATMRARWVPVSPLPSSSVTLDPTGIDSKSLSLAYDVKAGSNAVEFTFNADQDFSLRTTLRILYEVAPGGSQEDIVVEMRDSSDNVLLTGVAPKGTNTTGVTRWEVNLVPHVEHLTAVRKIRLAIRDAGDQTGTGLVLFDDVSLSSGTYSTCRACHGEFIGKPYQSLSDGVTWLPDLHDVHRKTMLNYDCNTCHTGSTFFPVFIGSSNGGVGLPPIGCLGCHGREEDQGHDAISSGRAAGLNQHHHRSGVLECAKCHTDADPANYTPVGENVHPAYYFAGDAAHPNKPTDPCSSSERFASPSKGLDNDGDLLYDLGDPDCQSTVPLPVLGPIPLGFYVALLLGLGIWRVRAQRRTKAPALRHG